MVLFNEGTEDPAGLSRKRNLRTGRRNGGRVIGEVFWGEGGSERTGKVEVETSCSPVVLELE